DLLENFAILFERSQPALQSLASLPDATGHTALHWAAARGNQEIVDALLHVNAVTPVRDMSGQTSLQWAARSGNTRVVQSLLANGADFNAGPATSLHWAA